MSYYVKYSGTAFSVPTEKCSRVFDALKHSFLGTYARPEAVSAFQSHSYNNPRDFEELLGLCFDEVFIAHDDNHVEIDVSGYENCPEDKLVDFLTLLGCNGLTPTPFYCEGEGYEDYAKMIYDPEADIVHTYEGRIVYEDEI